MIVKRRGGMTEYIPSPREKREALVRDHFIEAVELLHKRLRCIEQEFDLPVEDAQACASLLERIQEEEQQTVLVNEAIGKKVKGTLETLRTIPPISP